MYTVVDVLDIFAELTLAIPDPAIAIVGVGESNTAPLNVAVMVTLVPPFLYGAA